MSTSTEQATHLLNHVELFHRPGEGELVAQFFRALNCDVVDVSEEFGTKAHGVTYLCVFPGPRHPDILNNVLYVSEMRHPQPLEALLAQRAESDPELRIALEEHASTQTQGGRVMHFGLRYPDLEEFERVFDRLERALPRELEGRVTAYAPSAANLPALGASVLQGFVHTDVVGTGLFPFGQLIELQVHRPLET